MISFSISFSLQVSLSTFRFSFSNSLGLVARVDLLLFALADLVTVIAGTEAVDEETRGEPFEDGGAGGDSAGAEACREEGVGIVVDAEGIVGAIGDGAGGTNG